MIKKLLILLGIEDRYWYDSDEVMIMDNGVPVDSYIKRVKYDRLTGEQVPFKVDTDKTVRGKEISL